MAISASKIQVQLFPMFLNAAPQHHPLVHRLQQNDTTNDPAWREGLLPSLNLKLLATSESFTRLQAAATLGENPAS